MMDASKTGKNRGRFTKGDARINRKGRPRNFEDLRALAQQIAHEAPLGKDGEPLVVNGHKVSYAEFILRNWATSPDPRKQQAFIEYAYGKVPNEVTGPGGGPVQVAVVEVVKDYGSATGGDARDEGPAEPASGADAGLG